MDHELLINTVNSVSSQPTPHVAQPSAPYMVRILAKNKKGDQYKVEWSGLPGDGRWAKQSYLESREDGRRVLQEYRSRAETTQAATSDDV
jgi:hypothetical protein